MSNQQISTNRSAFLHTENLARVSDAALDQTTVNEAPHNHYKYPARFSPIFARSAIQELTEHGDTVLDPFVGGGTTLVEAMKLGRNALGTDKSSLASFVSGAKTTPLLKRDCHQLKELMASVESLRSADFVDLKKSFERHGDHYKKNMPRSLMRFSAMVLNLIDDLSARNQHHVRLALLSVVQWALESANFNPSFPLIRHRLLLEIEKYIDGQRQFTDSVANAAGRTPAKIINGRKLLNMPACHLTPSHIPKGWKPIKLVVTSPPYPGVHVLYHRWQVNGRKETSAPFWIANAYDGAGESFYTFGWRGQKELKSYYENLYNSYSSIHHLLADDAWIVQLVAFSEPEWQLPKFMDTMTEAGYESHQGKDSSPESNLWRNVPGRRWYARVNPGLNTSKEIMLVHRKA